MNENFCASCRVGNTHYATNKVEDVTENVANTATPDIGSPINNSVEVDESTEYILYSTGCPKCRVLESKLDSKNIKYKVINDENVIMNAGFMSVPVLHVIATGENLQFADAVKMVNEK